MTNHRFWLVAILLVASPLLAQDDDDEQPPGLRARYTVGTVSVERIDSDIAFPWGDTVPDERLPPGKFHAQWMGSLLLRSEEKHQFHAFVQGRLKLIVNGQVVLEGATDSPQWISGPETALPFGDQSFDLTFERTGDAAHLKLYWSSAEFPLEPVPYHVLFQTKPSPELSLIEQGRIEYEAFRCGNCHTQPSKKPGSASLNLPAPALDHVGQGTRRDWLIRKLTQSADATADPATDHGKMPHFGFAPADAEAIVAVLTTKAIPVDLTSPAKLKDSERDKDRQAGSTLIRSVGCLACHQWNKLGETTPFGGGSLDDLGQKRTYDWVNSWLANPAKVNAQHRMPIVTLTDKERMQIALALTGTTSPPAVPSPPAASDAVLARGTSLIESSRCASCHELPKLNFTTPHLPSLIGAKVDWERGCLQKPDREKSRPSFPSAHGNALKAYLASWTVVPVANEVPASALDGRRILQRKNCVACHDRDATRGIARLAAAIAKTDEALSGQHMTLIPPRLNAVGDRMHDTGLAEAIRGEQKTPRLNWLRVRMPKFAHSAQEQQSLLTHLIGHDRIPAAGPAQKTPVIAKSADPQRLLAGRELLGGKGFSCVACHAVKDYTPKVTALGTRGSNLHMIGQRMRTEYYFRWTRAPLRVMPGVEMPNYQRPHEFILPGQLDQQLSAIWEALNDPNLTAPSNPAVVEQFFSVGEQDLPRVVRDVFTVPGVAEETVARSFAIGLPGGHSVLFDLETCSVRGWTLGDFARQRCEGKRWYWDLAGTVLATRFDPRPDILLVHKTSDEVIGLETGWTVTSQLKRDERNSHGITLVYDLRFQKGETTYLLSEITDTFSILTSNSSSGWQRQITIKPSDTWWPWLRNANPGTIVEHARITADGRKNEGAASLPENAVRFNSDKNLAVTTVQYQTTLRWQNPRLNPAAPLMSRDEPITSVPGFRGQRLPLPRSIMPTALAWDSRNRLVFSSFKGHVYRLDPSQSGEVPLTTIEEGLAAPYGIIEVPVDPQNPAEQAALLIAHKPELLRLSLDSAGRVIGRKVFASGWGVTDDYHDWACGIVRDSRGDLFIGLGSDYTFKNRPITRSRWRGDILKIDSQGKIESIARGLRYPTGLTIDDQDRLFCTDQQGVQNTFNELNFIQAGHRYGVPSRHETEPNAVADPPAIQIPHPWTRSVNGVVWVPKSGNPGLAPIAGHMLAAEINNHVLIRMSLQTVGKVVQGAVYPFSRPAREGDPSNFVGPLCIGISPQGEVYVGGLQDGGWAGGLNVGEIVSLAPSGSLPNGIREIRATRQGFDIEFFHPVDLALARQSNQFKISGYTRVWKGDYATPDSSHHTAEVQSVAISSDGRTVALTVAGRRPGFVYDISVGEIGAESQRSLWPAIGHFTLHAIPE